jgi:glutathione S-transferase
MKIYYSPYSPFVRKVLVCAAELGIVLEQVANSAHPVNRDRDIVAHNPLGQVPTLLTGDGVLYDSRVICEYLNAQAGGALFPAAGPQRWRALVEQSLADGVLNACLLMRYEQVARTPGRYDEAWFDAQHEKVNDGLDRFEQWAGELGERVDIGSIAIACALGYLDLRFPDQGWRRRPALARWYERFAQRPSMRATQHPQ